MRFDHKHNSIPCRVGNFLFVPHPNCHVNELWGSSKNVTVSCTVSKVARDNNSHWHRDWKYIHKDLGNHLLQLCTKVVKHPL